MRIKKQIDNDETLEIYALMTPVERLKKGFEMMRWTKKLNKNYHLSIKERLKGSFILE